MDEEKAESEKQTGADGNCLGRKAWRQPRAEVLAEPVVADVTKIIVSRVTEYIVVVVKEHCDDTAEFTQLEGLISQVQ